MLQFHHGTLPVKSGNFCRMLIIFANRFGPRSGPTERPTNACSERFLKMLILKKKKKKKKKKNSRRHEKHKHYPACKEVYIGGRICVLESIKKEY